MNNLIRSITIFSVLFLTLGACDLVNLDDAKDPNALEADEGDVTLYLNGVQEQFARFVANVEKEPSEVVRITNMYGRIYRSAYPPSDFNTEWRRAYRSVLNNIRLLTPLAEKFGLYLHLGIAQVIEAYTVMVLVDLYGDIPYTEALKSNENLTPKLDGGASVYAAAIALLNSAISNFGKAEQAAKQANGIPNDLFYGGNWKNWIKVANSIKMRAYIATRLVDDQAITNFKKIEASDNFITSSAEDFQFEWGTSNANPDSRHPRYQEDYTPSGANTYMSNWLMNYMYENKTNNGNNTFEGPDPRMKYYFYRQVNKVSTNSNEINCVSETRPAHYTGFVFCSLPEGYWGRDHGNQQGIPPDGQKRTAYGLYPVGGKFDDNSFQPIESISVGAGGAGITPIMLASWVDIMRAEIALEQGDAGAAATHLQSGVRKSFQKVRAFVSRDASADLSQEPDLALDEAYITELGALFNGATSEERWNILGAEYFVTLFGNALEAFNFYRRTGSPKLQPNLEPNPGEFFRSFYYPPDASERNPNITQKSGVTDRVFWDTGEKILD